MARVTIWNEYRQERSDDRVRAVYPDGIHAALAEGLTQAGFDVRVATLDEPRRVFAGQVLRGQRGRVDAEHGLAAVDRLVARALLGPGSGVLGAACSSPAASGMRTFCGLTSRWMTPR